MNTVNKF